MQTRAPAEPEVREFEATVAAVDGRDVVLDATHFYAESGGQPADRGTLAGVPVTDVQVADGRVVHRLDGDPDLAPGETVVGVIDDDYRTYCTRAHTASHLLYGAARRLFEDLGYAGFDIDDERVRVDLATSSDVDDDALVELERLTNRAVWDSRPVTWAEVPAEAARAREDVAFNASNATTEASATADADAIRIVEIEGWDAAACGGTHVSNTREVGPIEVLDRSNPGEGRTRVAFSVGPAAVDRRATVRRAGLDAARRLGVGLADLDDAVADLQAERDDLASTCRAHAAEVLDARLSSLPTVERGGAVWRVGSLDGFDPNAVGEAVRERVDDDEAAVLAVVSGGSAPFVVVATTDDADADAGDVVADATARFGGGGGGGPTFAQGGGLDADSDAVVAHLRGERD